MAAVREGKCVDTTMAFTATAGLVMGARTGDLDPGFLIYVLRHEHLNAEQVADLVNKQSGLLGVSGISPDMKDLLDRESTDPHAAEAVELFCHQAAKYAAAMAVAAGGLDTLVFAAGIGERSASVRERNLCPAALAGSQHRPRPECGRGPGDLARRQPRDRPRDPHRRGNHDRRADAGRGQSAWRKVMNACHWISATKSGPARVSRVLPTA